MKVKIKLSVEQFKYLVWYIEKMRVEYSDEMQIINARLFIATGFKKLIDLQSVLRFSPNKIKTFAIEINQFYAILDIMAAYYDKLDSYMLAIYCSLKAASKSFFGIALIETKKY